MSVSFLSGEYYASLALIFTAYPSSSFPFPETSAVTCVCSEVKMTSPQNYLRVQWHREAAGIVQRVRCAGNFISLAWTVRYHFNGKVQLIGFLVQYYVRYITRRRNNFLCVTSSFQVYIYHKSGPYGLYTISEASKVKM